MILFSTQSQILQDQKWSCFASRNAVTKKKKKKEEVSFSHLVDAAE